MGIFMKILSDRRMQGVSSRIFWLFQGGSALLPRCLPRVQEHEAGSKVDLLSSRPSFAF